MRLKNLAQGLAVEEMVPGEDVTVVAVDENGSDAVVLTYRDGECRLDEKIFYRSDDPNLP